MKRLVLISVLLFSLIQIYSQNGWREGEMEVAVVILNRHDLQVLHSLHLNGEPGSADGSMIRVYAIPAEYAAIKNNGLVAAITIPDLNRYSREKLQDGSTLGYYNYTTINALADSLASAYPAFCKKILLGNSAGGKQLAVLKISDNVNTNENEPEILFEGGIHGDEIMGPEIVIRLARDLCNGYGSNPVYTDLINTREIWMYYLVNPDGYVSMSRYNANGVDINRDCGYMWDGEGFSSGPFSQPESKVIRGLQIDHNPVVFTCYHGGTEVISYPWSYKTEAPADAVHINHLASVYSNTSGYPNLGYGQGYNIMYQIFGSTKDNVYGSLGQVGWSIEITDVKQPPPNQIGLYYGYNQPAMTEMIVQAGYGVEGVITDSLTGSPVAATVWVDGFFPVYTDPAVGDYHKYVLPGTHSITVRANGYKSKTVSGVSVPATGSVVTDFQLIHDSGRYAYQVISSQIPSYPNVGSYPDESYTPGVLGPPDTIAYSLGKSGWIVIDMGDTVYNAPGPDFTVWENDATPEGYYLYAGTSMDGPWVSLGNATGTHSFDLDSGPVAKARYLKIVDDGDGSISMPDAGFDLDAIEFIMPPLYADFTSATTVLCTGDSTSFLDASSGSPVSWNWSFPGGTPSSSTLQNPSGIIYFNPGTYDVTLTVSDGYTTSSVTKTGFISVSGIPQVDLGPDTLACLGDSVILDAGNPGCAYLWSTGETSRTISVFPDYPGYYSYWVEVTNENNCTGSDEVQLNFVICDGLPETGPGMLRVYPNPSEGMFFVHPGEPLIAFNLFNRVGSLIRHGRITDQEMIDITDQPAGIYILQVITEDGAERVVRIVIQHQ